MSTTPPADLSQMMSQVDGAAPGKPLPPVEAWNPPNCGAIDIRIARDGRWYHEGSPIGREPLVRLFSTILRHDPDGYYLVTPVEKLKITVEDAPFIAVRVDQVDGVLRFTTNLGDATDAGPDHPLRVTVDPKTGEPAPYVHVRGGLLARLARPVFYELVEMGVLLTTSSGPQVAVESGGVWFTLGSIDPTKLDPNAL
ncbi:MAG: DUF1285 domain-containing protein [Caulobacteraceae bacterium]